MDYVLVGYIISIVLGLLLGSFAGATVWRLRARQLVEDKAAGEAVPKSEYKKLKPLTKDSLTKDRSRCLSCDHTLEWYDLLPLVSWCSTGGRCRYCKQPIGWFEPLTEIVTATVFLLLYHNWVMTHGFADLWLLGLLAVALLGLIILFFYDLKWLLLPNVVMWPVIVLSAVISAVQWSQSSEPSLYALSTLGAVAILSGLYLVLWLVSRGRWVGFGDVKLGLALGLLLGDWQLAFLTLFLANLIGTLIVLPGLISKRLTRKSQIPFGPLLIIGFWLSLFFGTFILDWYSGLITGATTTMLML